MAGVSDYMVRILKLAQDDPRYRQLAEYLIQRRAMPDFKFDYGDAQGSYEQNTWAGRRDLPQAGRINLDASYGRQPENAVSPLVHEMTHASMRQLGQQYMKIKNKGFWERTPEEIQFMENYTKMYGYNMNDESIGMRGLLSKLAPKEWVNENKGYRAASNEVPAWGMGESGGKPSGLDNYNTPAHLNPSAATEFQLLLDQAQKLQSATYNKSQGR